MNLRLEAMVQHLHFPGLRLKIVQLTDEVVTLEHPILKERVTWAIEEFAKFWEIVE